MLTINLGKVFKGIKEFFWNLFIWPVKFFLNLPLWMQIIITCFLVFLMILIIVAVWKNKGEWKRVYH